MQYVYMAISGVFLIETLAVVILSKVCKKRKEQKVKAEQLAETYKAMYSDLESKVANLQETIIKLKEVQNEKVDVNAMSDTDVSNALNF